MGSRKPWCGSYHLRGPPADSGGVSGPVCLGGPARPARWTVRGRTARHLVNPAEPGGGNKGHSEGRTTARGGEGGAGALPCLPWGLCRGWAGPHDVLEALKRGHKSAASGTGLAFSFPSTAPPAPPKQFFLTPETPCTCLKSVPLSPLGVQPLEGCWRIWLRLLSPQALALGRDVATTSLCDTWSSVLHSWAVSTDVPARSTPSEHQLWLPTSLPEIQQEPGGPSGARGGGWVVPPVATCQGPSDGREMCWDVLFTGGLAPGPLTSEVSPPKKRALFVVRAWGLAGALGRRESASGAGVAPAEEKNPLSVRSRLPGLPARGTVDNCWSAWPALRPGVPRPGRCVLL